jgi:uncharacterized protein (DUF1697 family)
VERPTPAAEQPVRHVAFVRNIMIGREGMTRQALLGFFVNHGATDPVSYISTGNVGFTCGPSRLNAIVSRVEESIAGVLGRSEPLYVRTLARLAEIAAEDPFAGTLGEVAADRVVTFTQDRVDLSVELPFTSERGDVAILRIGEREIYSVSILVDGRTRGPGGFIERLVGERVTTRSWNTVQRVVAKESVRS